MVSPLAFASVTLDPTTTMAGFTPSNFSFTGSQIQVDWQNLPFDKTTIVKLDVAVVPEPDIDAIPSLAVLAGVLLRKRAAFRCR